MWPERPWKSTSAQIQLISMLAHISGWLSLTLTLPAFPASTLHSAKLMLLLLTELAFPCRAVEGKKAPRAVIPANITYCKWEFFQSFLLELPLFGRQIHREYVNYWSRSVTDNVFNTRFLSFSAPGLTSGALIYSHSCFQFSQRDRNFCLSQTRRFSRLSLPLIDSQAISYARAK